jgi:hypothetical protein
MPLITISAAMMASQARPIEIRRPVKMQGRSDGMRILVKSRRRLVLLEDHQGDRHPRQRWHHPEELEEGIEGTVQRGAQAEAGDGLPEETLVEASPVVEGIHEQFPGPFLDPEAEGAADPQKRRHDGPAVSLPPQGSGPPGSHRGRMRVMDEGEGECQRTPAPEWLQRLILRLSR